MSPLFKFLYRFGAPFVAFFALSFVYFLYSLGYFGIEYKTRNRLTRARADMRSVASALENYRAQNGSYPPMRKMTELGYSIEDLQGARAEGLSTYETGGPNRQGLTTPIAYLSILHTFNDLNYDDPFAQRHSLPYAYWTDGAGRWLLCSIGPDRHFNIQHPEKEARKTSRSLEIINQDLIYDPTNGTFSEGDIVRFSE